MPHPFLKLPSSIYKRLFWFFLGMTMFATWILQRIDGALQTAAAPHGIVSYELAGNASVAGAIMASWNANAQLHAAFSLGFDYLYMLAYSVTLALTALWLADVHTGALRKLGVMLAWGMGAAGLADALENYFLWQMLVSGPAETPARLAQWAAMLKFTLILLTFIYVIVSLAAYRFVRKQSTSSSK
jgi:hypothetical protein